MNTFDTYGKRKNSHDDSHDSIEREQKKIETEQAARDRVEVGETPVSYFFSFI